MIDFRVRLIESVQEGLLVIEPTGRMKLVNRAAERILGRSRKALVGAQFQDERWWCAELFKAYRRGIRGESGRWDGLGLGLFIVAQIAAAHGGMALGNLRRRAARRSPSSCRRPMSIIEKRKSQAVQKPFAIESLLALVASHLAAPPRLPM